MIITINNMFINLYNNNDNNNNNNKNIHTITYI